MNDTDSSRGSVTDSKDVVRSLVDKIPEDILEQTRVRKKKVTFKEDTEHLGPGQELQTDPSSGTYNLEIQEIRGGEELERIAVSRKPYRELSCNSNVRTNLVPEDDMKIVKRMICVKLSDDIHKPGEMNGQIMALKEHVKARYRLSDLIRAQKNDKMTSNLSKWIQSGVKEKGGTRGRQLQDLEPVLQREKILTLPHS